MDARTVVAEFHLRSVENGLLLCPNCHTEFDRAHDPGFVFIPIDLEYFIKFEEKDKANRQDPARPGMMSRQRHVPTIQEYRQHLVDQKLIPADVQYGYYLTYPSHRTFDKCSKPTRIQHCRQTMAWQSNGSHPTRHRSLRKPSYRTSGPENHIPARDPAQAILSR
ncbi:hypothetical protein BJX62DRAFT_1139 [Aspergillus germanicus]